jgi:hypothetical protein
VFVVPYRKGSKNGPVRAVYREGKLTISMQENS